MQNVGLGCRVFKVNGKREKKKQGDMVETVWTATKQKKFS